MASQRWMLALCFSLASVLVPGGSLSTTETHKHTCRTFGSGVVQTFNGSLFYMRSTCPFTLTRFTHNRVECDITTRRGDAGLLVQVEIIINKIRTILQNGSILVEKKSVSLPYDHTYQHVFHYGIYTKLRSSLLPVSVTWHSVPGGIDTLWVELEQELSSGMTGLCGTPNVPGNKQELIAESVLSEDTCQIRDPLFTVSTVCRLFLSYTLDCLQARTPDYIQLCEENIYSYEQNKYIRCAFFKEVVQQCGKYSYAWNIWRTVTECDEPTCPGELLYEELGETFFPSCSNPNPRASDQDLTSSCVCPKGKVLNDHADGYHCVSVSDCPCVFAGRSYTVGNTRSTKCQSCLCKNGKWECSENLCPARCLIEGQFVTTFDGKQYAVPGKCSYVASKGLNWTISIQFSEKASSLKTVILELFQETYTFSSNMVMFGEKEIVELHQSDHAVVFWQSSMYVQVQTSFGLKIQVQVSPEIQLYVTPPGNHTGVISGLCGNSNADTTDDFTTSSGIIENSAQPFALSWSVGDCTVNIPTSCINTDNEIFADEKCVVLRDPSGIFAKCYNHIPTEYYHMACIQTTCSCGGSLQQCLCVALGNYATACASQGILVGDWRKATNCTLTCKNNQEFSYDMRACNHTCRSLSGPDSRCGLDNAPVEGCGCLEGTHLNQGLTCIPKAQCPCHHQGGTTPPGPVVIDGRQCHCENGELHCSTDCGCRNGKVCVHCSQYPVNTAQKTCDSLSKPLSAGMKCQSGCFCPDGQYEDHRGDCVSLDNCTCMYSGKVFSAGQIVKTNCKTCICSQGEWHCKAEPCPGKCQVYGNGHYQTFDSKWYRFDGNCQYTLVEDDCGSGEGSFSVRVESVPCCDEALTCSRSIVLDLQGEVTLTLADMRVTRRLHTRRSAEAELYSTHTVGLYIMISVPSRGLILIWDKHTRITIELDSFWRNRVCGLCGNFDSSEMNDLQIRGSTVVSSSLAFGNSWKMTMPPCSDVTNEVFPCERHSYCSAWAQRRCMILKGDTFKVCHFKVDPEPFYQACVQESCSCEFEGKFLGFCTAVAAYAEACSDQDICVKWRTPDMCPVYCDYYNEQGQCSWHYEPCGQIQTCGKNNRFTGKLEGCYPRCPAEALYYDENTGECSSLTNCTCYFNDTVIQPGTVVSIHTKNCSCKNGIIQCENNVLATTPTTLLTTTPSEPATAATVWTSASIKTTTSTTTLATTSLQSTTTPMQTTAMTPSITTPTQPTTTTTPSTTTTGTSASTTTVTFSMPTHPTTTTPSTTPITSTTSTSASTTTVTSSTPTQPTTTTPSTTPITSTTSTSASTTTVTSSMPTQPTTTTSNTPTPTTTSTSASTTTVTFSMPTQLTTTTPSTTPITSTTSTSASTTTVTSSTPTQLTTTTLTTPITSITSTSASTTTETSSTPTQPTTTTSNTPTPTTTSTSASTSTETLSTPTQPTTTTSNTPTPTTTSTSASTTTETMSMPTQPTTSSTTPITSTTSTVATSPSTPSAARIRTTPTRPTTTTATSSASVFTEPATTKSPSTVASTQPITSTSTTSTEPTSTVTTTTQSPTSVTPTTVLTTTLFTSFDPSTTNAPTATSVQTMTEHMKPTATAAPKTNTFATNATTAETTALTEFTSAETQATATHSTAQSTTTATSSLESTSQVVSTTSLEATTSHEITSKSTTMQPTTGFSYSTKMSTNQGFTNETLTTYTELTTSEETATSSTTSENTRATAGATTPTFTTIRTETVTHFEPKTGSVAITTAPHTSPQTECRCRDLKRNQSWVCNETWTEDCFNKICTEDKIELTPVVCPKPTIPSCPRGQVRKVSDGCCEAWMCDCRCDLYGDPHYISFQGVTFDFLESCTYILVEERSPRHHLTIAVDNYLCVPGLKGSCAKGIILKYQNNTATLSIIPNKFTIEATLNNVTVQPPYEEHGLRFETTGYMVSVYLPEVRSHVTFTPAHTLVVSLAMEHFLNNTQGQCGVCGGGSCIRRGGQIEEDSCCDNTAYDWVYMDPLKPACAAAPRDVPCHPEPGPTTQIPPSTCPGSPLCHLLHHTVFAECSKFVDLNLKARNCRFDSCGNSEEACSSLEQAAEECKKAGICIDWRRHTNGSCDVECPKGMVYGECRDKLDDFCYGGVRFPGTILEELSEGCFCPSKQFRTGKHTNTCVSDCSYCKGPLGEPKMPGEVWQSSCNLCTCNKKTRTEKCFPKPPRPTPVCSHSSVLVNSSCCGDQICIEKKCSYNEKMYKVGDRWKDAAHPCVSYSCSREGIHAETRVCPSESCPEEDRIWDDQHCCFACNQSCAPRVSSVNITIDNCTTTLQLPMCQGQCASQSSVSWVVVHGVLQVEQRWSCCKEQSSEKRSVALQCLADSSTRYHSYQHITSCQCRGCSILR